MTKFSLVGFVIFFSLFGLIYLIVLPSHNPVEAATYYLSCSNGSCSYTDNSGNPTYQGSNTVSPPLLTQAIPSCMNGQPVVNLNWQNSPTSGVSWTHFDRFEITGGNLSDINVVQSGSNSSLPIGTILDTNVPVQIDLGYAGSAQMPQNTTLDSYLIPYPSYIQLKPNTSYIYSLRAQTGGGNPPVGLQSPPSNVLLLTTPTCPQPFNQYQPVVTCAGTTAAIDLSWQTSVGAANYFIKIVDSANNIPFSLGGGIKTTSFTLPADSRLMVGHFYGFSIQAVNRSLTGSIDSDNGWWSQTLYGWIQYPDCSPPGIFHFSAPPTARCQSIGDGVIDVNWSGAANALGYKIYPQPNPQIYPYPAGLDPTSLSSNAGYLMHSLPIPIPPHSQWDYNIMAYNSNGISWISGPVPSTTIGSSVYHHGWTDAPNCANPALDLTIDSGDYFKTIYSNTLITLNYILSNSTECISRSNPVINSITLPWTTLFPAGSNGYHRLNDNWSSSGNTQITPINDNSYPNPSYQFSIECINSQLPVINPVSKTVTVTVLPERPAFIQTTGGDVHSNKDIIVPNQ